MQRISIKDLWKISKGQAQPLLGSLQRLSTLPFMAGYLEDTQHFDKNIAKNKGFFQPLWNLDDEETAEEVLSAWRDDCYGVLLKNYQNYNRLYNLMLKEYEPLENYNMEEFFTDSADGMDKIIDTIDDKESTNSYGEKTTTSTDDTSTDNHTIGATKNTSENEIAGFNSSYYSDSDKSTNESVQHTDTDVYGMKKNTLVENTHTDTHTEDGYEDTHTTEYGKVTTHDGTKKGNLGVTTSQQMALSEIDLWTKFKFYDVLIDDIIKELCTYRED